VEVLEAIRGLAEGPLRLLVEPKGIVFESPEPEGREAWALRRFLRGQCAALFGDPQGHGDGTVLDDVFEEWHQDEFFLAFVNGRVAWWWPVRRPSPCGRRASPC
jgi:hypothetical protein